MTTNETEYNAGYKAYWEYKAPVEPDHDKVHLDYLNGWRDARDVDVHIGRKLNR